jgi:DNA polymerase-3 subunit delta'
MFENIIGNNNIKEVLEKSVKLQKTSHSYLFVGTEGIGKKLIAKEFAKMIMCLDEEKYCDKCKSCIEFNTNNNPDYIFIEPDGNNIKIEQIRQMQTKVAEKPIISNKKVYIIDNVELMTVEAQNCLLKTLEEPPEYVTIILICKNENSILNTIKSRCTIIHFEKIENSDIKKYLEKNYEMNNIQDSLLDIFQGSIGKAIRLKDKVESYEKIEYMLKNINNKDIIEILELSEILYKSKDDIEEILEYINVILLNLSKENIRYIRCIDIIEETKKRLKANSNYDMTIDNMLFSIWEEVNEKHCRS